MIMQSVKIFLILLFSLLSSFSWSQLTIVINEVPENTSENATLYFASSINQWTPNHPDYSFMLNNNQEYILRIDSLIIGETIEFKITLGTWQLTEGTSEGLEIENRSLVYTKEDTVYMKIARWTGSDDVVLATSAAPNVEVIFDEFYIPQLDRYRRIWIYLPPDYEIELEKNYALLYMHDGQNLFDNKTAFSGEWKVDEKLNSLFEIGQEVPIVVGIDNGGVFRNNEYSIEDNEEYNIKGEGEEYLAFINETLHPYIESHYRTISDRESIGVMGSSLGGLISYYGVVYYPELFGLAGILSPAYWIDQKLLSKTVKSDSTFRIIQIAGDMESPSMTSDIHKVDSLLSTNYTNAIIKSEIIQGGKHNEQFWSDQFTQAVLFLYSK